MPETVDIAGTDVNLADLIVFGILLLSGALAFARGFTREILAIIGWAAAVYATLEFQPRLSPLARDYIQPNTVADGIVIVGVFVITLVVMTMITHTISSRVKDSAIGALDRTLGFFFGVARGALAIAALYLGLALLVEEDGHPELIRTAKSQPLMQAGAELILSIAPSMNRPAMFDKQEIETLEQMGTSATENGGSLLDAKDTLETLIDLLPPMPGSDEDASESRSGDAGQNGEPGADTGSETGYKRDERKAMDQLY